MHDNIEWLNVGIFLLIMMVLGCGIKWVQYREKASLKDDSEKRFENLELD